MNETKRNALNEKVWEEFIMRPRGKNVIHCGSSGRKPELERAHCQVPNVDYPPDLERIAKEQFDRAAMRRRLLTPRQLEVASLVAEGINSKEIAPRLGIGEECVKKHIAAAMRKANVDRRTKLARWLLGL
jgi:DNA-binding NarL/FixJ family response regulator